MKLSSPDFAHEGRIPRRFTCDGEGTSPALEIQDIPEGTRSLALIVDDPDAPSGTFVHWVLFNVAPTDSIARGSKPGVEGTNDYPGLGYGGPCPPSGTHRYYFKLYALDALLDLKEGAERDKLERAMQGHIKAEAQLMGLYGRPR